MVLNGNGITGAADVASVDVRNRRYVITGTGNAPRSDFPRSIVMYRLGSKKRRSDSRATSG